MYIEVELFAKITATSWMKYFFQRGSLTFITHLQVNNLIRYAEL